MDKLKTFIILWIFKFLFTLVFFYKYNMLSSLPFAKYFIGNKTGNVVFQREDETKRIHANTTVVSAYLKPSDCIQKYRPRSEKTYFEWAQTFGLIQNPMLIYSDSEQFLELVSAIRRYQPTITQLINRSDIWAFSLQHKIGRLMSNYVDRSVHFKCPDYVSISCAKFDVMSLAVRYNPFSSNYFAWLDIGCFRSLVSGFQLRCSPNLDFKVPADFDASKISAVLNPNHMEQSSNSPIKQIYLSNAHTVGAPGFIGKRSQWSLFVPNFRHYAECLLDRGIIPLEQTVLSAMLNKVGNQWCHPPEIGLQLHSSGNESYEYKNLTPESFSFKCRKGFDNFAEIQTHKIFYFCYKMALF